MSTRVQRGDPGHGVPGRCWRPVPKPSAWIGSDTATSTVSRSAVRRSAWPTQVNPQPPRGQKRRWALHAAPFSVSACQERTKRQEVTKRPASRHRWKDQQNPSLHERHQTDHQLHQALSKSLKARGHCQTNAKKLTPRNRNWDSQVCIRVRPQIERKLPYEFTQGLYGEESRQDFEGGAKWNFADRLLLSEVTCFGG